MVASAASNQPAQHLQGLYSRNLGHLRRSSSKPITPVTPSDDLTSWLGDDLCAHCAKAVSSGQLYCSADCSTADETATAIAQADQKDLHVPSPQVGTSQHYRAGSASRTAASPNYPFRYYCPPSPNLLAQYNKPAQALTSPALTAFQRSLPSHRRGARAPQHVPSDTSEDSVASAPVQRPGSSHSTFSSDSTSDAAYTTDPSSNSPAIATTSGDDNSDSEPSQLNLPPAMHSSVLLKHQRKSTARVSSAGGPPPSATLSAAASSGPRRSSGPTSRPPPSSMRFARRPSSTNLPPPVLYSPILTPSQFSTKASAPYSSSSSSAKSNPSPTHSHPALSYPQSYDAATASFVKMGRSAARELAKVDWVQHHRHSNGVDALAMARGSSDQTSDRSPPPLLSAASSAGKTLMALSPNRTIGRNFLCGRPGCDGSVARRSSMTSLSSSTEAPPNIASARRASSPRTWSKPPVSHKHTHSASAGLGRATLQRASSAIKGLTMTPSREEARLPDSPTDRRGRRTERYSPDSISPCTDLQGPVTPSSPAVEREDRSAPRGRSHKRGDRSSSRRARSPSRDRRRLQASLERQREVPVDSLSPKSNPIEISSQGRSPRSLEELAAAAAVKAVQPQSVASPQREAISPLALRARHTDNGDDSRRRSRGRSPPAGGRGRGRAGAPAATASPVDSMTSSRASMLDIDTQDKSASEDRGFDDVELELS